MGILSEDTEASQATALHLLKETPDNSRLTGRGNTYESAIEDLMMSSNIPDTCISGQQL